MHWFLSLGTTTDDEPMSLVFVYSGVPSEFNEFLPKDCEEFKKWKASLEGAVEGEMEKLTVEAKEKEKKSSGKKKKKSVPRVVLERNIRNRKKCITTISGLDLFGVKLNEAAKLFGKKFASGASVTKNAESKEQIDCQGDFLDQAVDIILKQYKEVKKSDIYFIEAKKKQPYFPDEAEEE